MLLQVYLTTQNPLLGSLLRVQNHCNYQRTVALLLKYKKNDELVEFYKAKKHHRKALDFLSEYITVDVYKKIVGYLVQMDMNNDLDIILEHSDYVLNADIAWGLSIFTENYQDITVKNRRKIFNYLNDSNPKVGKSYLEHLVIVNHDNDTVINTYLFNMYLNEALNLQDDINVVNTFRDFVVSCKYYNAEKVLKKMPKDSYLIETAHILSRLYRHEEALKIYVEKLADYEGAEKYCGQHYKRNDPKSNRVYSTLFALYCSNKSFNMTKMIEYLNTYGYKMDSDNVCKY
jgi:hypothetical protein